MRDSGTAVAKRKRSKGERPPTPQRRLSVQASDDWIAWVEDGAEYCRTDVSKLVDVALATYLKAQGFTKAPPRRVP